MLTGCCYNWHTIEHQLSSRLVLGGVGGWGLVVGPLVGQLQWVRFKLPAPRSEAIQRQMAINAIVSSPAIQFFPTKPFRLFAQIL
jgi:hypothetical protein